MHDVVTSPHASLDARALGWTVITVSLLAEWTSSSAWATVVWFMNGRTSKLTDTPAKSIELHNICMMEHSMAASACPREDEAPRHLATHVLWTPRVELTHRAISARQHIVLYAHLSFCFTFFKGDENVQNYIVLITFQEFNFLLVIDSHPSLRAKLRSLPHKMAELWDVSFMLYFLLCALFSVI